MPDMRTGPVPGKPGRCWPAWSQIKKGHWECDECEKGPCKAPVNVVEVLEK